MVSYVTKPVADVSIFLYVFLLPITSYGQ